MLNILRLLLWPSCHCTSRFRFDKRPQTMATSSAIPASGRRIPLSAAVPFPDEQYALQPPCSDINAAPAYLGTAYVNHAAYPCKIIPSQSPACRLSMDGQEFGHLGRYDLLPFDAARMEMVRASAGQLPAGRRLVHGGHEEDGRRLYHSVVSVGPMRIAGRTGEHLGGALIPYGGREIFFAEYDVVCWRA